MAVVDDIASMPKVELHVHLEGSIRPPLLLSLAERNGIDLGVAGPDELAERYVFRDFDHFIELYLLGMSALRSGRDIVDMIAALSAELAAQHVRYAEVTTTAYLYKLNGLSQEEYTAALDEGAAAARAQHALELRWIVDVPRSMEAPDEHWTANLLTGPHAPREAVAMGLGGPEATYPAEWYADTFARARAAGVPAVIHAGETAGPDSIRNAIGALHSRRLGHGVRVVEDPTLVQELAESQIVFEVCPTSNVLLGVAPSIEQHQLREMVAAGLAVTINSDDPAYFATTLTDELRLAHEVHGLSVDDLRACQRRAIAAALCDDDTRASVARSLD
jgi:aminodeoxyfutalosine deaminase